MKTGCVSWAMFGMSDKHRVAARAVELATSSATTLEEFGCGVVEGLTPHVSFDRFNIGVIDLPRYLFHDEFVFGTNVTGRLRGHQRALDGTVVEAALQAGAGYYFGNSDLQQWLERFPRFEPVFESGIRSMLAVPLRHNDTAVAALVFASTDPNAYGQESLAIAVEVGEVVLARIESLTGLAGNKAQ